MFDHNAMVLAHMRAEEVHHHPHYERLIRRSIRRPPLRDRMLVVVGRLLVRWGMALERRHSRVERNADWLTGRRPLGGVL